MTTIVNSRSDGSLKWLVLWLSLGLTCSFSTTTKRTATTTTTATASWHYDELSSISPTTTRARPSTSTRRYVSPLETTDDRNKALESIKALDNTNNDDDDDENNRRKPKKQYKRKRDKPPTEIQAQRLKKQRQAKYDQVVKSNNGANNKRESDIWSFESLFPEPILDEVAMERDLYSVAKRDKKTKQTRPTNNGDANQVSAASSSSSSSTNQEQQLRSSSSSSFGGSNIMKIFPKPKLADTEKQQQADPIDANNNSTSEDMIMMTPSTNATTMANGTINKDMTRLVEQALYGIRRTPEGDFQYETSLNSDGAVQFRDGVRLSKPLKVNADRITYYARRDLKFGRLEEAQELYEHAIEIDPADGRAYLGLSRIAERRRDFKLARECLRAGIANSVSVDDTGQPDSGSNPFLLQAFGCLEEKAGHLAQAEALYLAAVKSRPSHAAAWVALAQLRTRKLRQSAASGRVCYQTAELELSRAGKRPSSHVYTAWAALEYKKAGDVRRARKLFQAALKVDKQCSAAFLQLGVMETNQEDWETAEELFERVLEFDPRNARVLQAYAIMETKRPDGSSRKAIGLFERALKAKPRDAGVFQAYALFVADLGDTDAARSLLQRGTEMNKRHAPLWQAWGVLESRAGNAKAARNIFQQGIWSCSQLSGGQSGGYKCARLWQAWGCLEASQNEQAAARRCFSRALDADKRNIASFTAWALMEQDIGQDRDARSIYERALKQFPAGSDEKTIIWSAYEAMEQRLGNVRGAQSVYQRSMRETLTNEEVEFVQNKNDAMNNKKNVTTTPNDVAIDDGDVAVARWNDMNDAGPSMRGEVWMNEGSIEAQAPASILPNNGNKKRRPKKQQ